MNVSDLLNPVTAAPTATGNRRSRCVSTPVHCYNSNRYYSQYQKKEEEYIDQEDQHHSNSMVGKPRSRFSEYEDNIIRQGVAQRLTWGQISDLLPHRKRATCFNRYRTLQGIRKSRKQSESPPMMSTSLSSSPSLSPVTSCFSTSPTTPPPPSHNTIERTSDIMYPLMNEEEEEVIEEDDNITSFNHHKKYLAFPPIKQQHHFYQQQQPYYSF